MFGPIDRSDISYPKLYTKIIDSIRSLLQEGVLKVGDKLPSERELAERYQVSRVPVREALKILEYMGVVTNIPGRGMFIRGNSIEDVLDILNLTIVPDADSIQELFEVREATEIQAVRLTAQRRTAEDLQKMEDALTHMEQEIEMGESGIRPSLDFHLAIMRATRNRILYQQYIFWMDLLELSREKTLSSVERRRTSLEAHRLILEHIRNRDESAAAEAMAEHLRKARDAFRSNLPSI